VDSAAAVQAARAVPAGVATGIEASVAAASRPGESLMSLDWKIRIQPAEKKPYEFKATLLLRSAADASALNVNYLYGDGDLAVFLEDLGARAPEIWVLLEELHGRRTAEILVDVKEEAMEVLARHAPEAQA
jgi:hypothetical protein